VRKRSAEKLLRDTKVELAEGEALLLEKKRAKKRARSKLARKNAARSAAIVEKAVHSIAAHRELLKRKVRHRKKPPPGGRGRSGRKGASE
jgi:hypothetical protein